LKWQHNDKYAIHKLTKHSCIENRLRRYRKQTGNINPHPLRRSRITYSIPAYYYKCHLDKEAYTKPKKVRIFVKLEVFIWRHVVYVPKSSTTFRRILICVTFRLRDMQEYYMLFWIFARDVGLYSLSVFYKYFPFLLNWCLWMITFTNLKTYLSSAWNTFSVVISNIFGKKRNIIVTFQSYLVTKTFLIL
jgi:hypothetical protein